MTPREAADRLFERAMREHGGPDSERGLFFVDMALQAYAAVPPEQVDADLHFHIGLLRLVQGDSTGVRRSVETILGSDEEHLLGLVLAARLADYQGDGDRADQYRVRVRSAVEAAGGVPDLPEYQSHRPLIDAVLMEVGEEGS